MLVSALGLSGALARLAASARLAAAAAAAPPSAANGVASKADADAGADAAVVRACSQLLSDAMCGELPLGGALLLEAVLVFGATVEPAPPLLPVLQPTVPAAVAVACVRRMLQAAEWRTAVGLLVGLRLGASFDLPAVRLVESAPALLGDTAASARLVAQAAPTDPRAQPEQLALAPAARLRPPQSREFFTLLYNTPRRCCGCWSSPIGSRPSCW